MEELEKLQTISTLERWVLRNDTDHLHLAHKTEQILKQGGAKIYVTLNRVSLAPVKPDSASLRCMLTSSNSSQKVSVGTQSCAFDGSLPWS